MIECKACGRKGDEREECTDECCMLHYDLCELINKSRLRKMTAKEIYQQRVSFVWGMLPFESKRTIDDVKQSLAQLGYEEPA